MTDDVPGRATRQPIFNVPTGVIVLLAVLLGVQLLRSGLSPAWDEYLIEAGAFIPARYTHPDAASWPGHGFAPVTQWVTHMLLHGGYVHLLFNSAWLLAFGGAVANRIGSLRAIAFAALCGFAGALVFLVVRWGEISPMVGASGAVLGLMGASMRFLIPALDHGRGSLRDIHSALHLPLMPLAVALKDPRVLASTAMLVVLNFAGAFGMAPAGAEGPIAWEAHAGGYLAGLLLFGFFDTAPHNAPTSQEPDAGGGKPPLH